jgi:hypothetical protein
MAIDTGTMRGMREGRDRVGIQPDPGRIACLAHETSPLLTVGTDTPSMDEEAGHVGCLVADDLQEQLFGRELQDAGADPDFTGGGKRPGQSPSHAATGANVNPGFEIGRVPHDREASEQCPRARGQRPR